MKDRGLWADCHPSSSALASTEPFACDTLSFVQWLQFIFIPKFKSLINHQQQLPSNMAIHPAAQVWLKEESTIQQLLLRIDEAVIANSSTGA
nr:YqcC family protein [Alteromonas sp. ASW11-130]